MSKDTKLEELAANPLFVGSDRRQLERIARVCTSVRLPAGWTVVREGRPARQLLVVERGQARVWVDGEPVAVLRAGDVFGERALLSGGSYEATVTASTDLQVLTLTRRELSSLLAAAPFVGARILARTAARASGPTVMPRRTVPTPRRVAQHDERALALAGRGTSSRRGGATP